MSDAAETTRGPVQESVLTEQKIRPSWRSKDENSQVNTLHTPDIRGAEFANTGQLQMLACFRSL